MRMSNSALNFQTSSGNNNADKIKNNAAVARAPLAFPENANACGLNAPLALLFTRQLPSIKGLEYGL